MSYDKEPVIPVGAADQCLQGWTEVVDALNGRVAKQQRCVMAVECYPGVDVRELREATSALAPASIVMSAEALRPASELERLLAPYVGDDPVFGFMCPWELARYFAPPALERLRRRVAAFGSGLVLVLGPGASLVAPDADVLVYADITRWELQQRQRRGLVGSLGANDRGASPAALYKRGFFADWRAADRQRATLLGRIDFYLDTNLRDDPRMASGEAYRSALELTTRRPFRLVPFFDPGPWGGEWMRSRFDLPADAPNFAWCFDCVPEENSLLFGFGDRRLHVPALPLVHRHPEALLGRDVHERFGAEFPIRFDFLDTMGGGNLSLQVHPLQAYIEEHFGMPYTQDESYYLLDAGPDAVVYLGLREQPNRKRFERELRLAQDDGQPFPVAEHVNAWPARKHDHFSIPAGTIHCSGANSMVLEISATPYIFTFKLWDWERLGLDARPRPIHLDHGLANIQWDRTTDWVRRNLVNPVREVDSGPGIREEVTGLHSAEFIETRRHWFTAPVEHDTAGTVNVLNLVEGEEAIVESPDGAFEPFHIHYAETFVVPASVGRYRIRPIRASSPTLATIKAFVRSRSSALGFR